MAADEKRLASIGLDFAKLGAAIRGDGPGYDPDKVVTLAARAMPHAGHCGLTLVRAGRRPQTLSASDPLPVEVDRIQFATGEGPCLAASMSDGIEVSENLERDPRWPRFGPRCAAETGVHSMLAVRLALAGGDHAAINFYALQEHAFDDLDLAIASTFAPFAALAVEHTLREEDAGNFQEALSSSRQIGTAIGILMARKLVTASNAFELLRSASQHLNRKLRDLAVDVAETGELPALPGDQDAESAESPERAARRPGA